MNEVKWIELNIAYGMYGESKAKETYFRWYQKIVQEDSITMYVSTGAEHVVHNLRIGRRNVTQ